MKLISLQSDSYLLVGEKRALVDCEKNALRNPVSFRFRKYTLVSWRLSAFHQAGENLSVFVLGFSFHAVDFTHHYDLKTQTFQLN